MSFIYLAAGIYSALAITGLIGNLWVLITVLGQLFTCINPRTRNSMEGGRRRLILPGVQSSACIYLLMLSVVDLISFIPVPFLVMDIIHNQWLYSNLLCKLLYTCEGINKSLSPFVLTALSVDRYIAVCRPTLIWMRQSSFALCVLVVCIGASSFFIVFVTFRSEVRTMMALDGLLHRKCTIKMPPVFNISLVIGCYVTPLIVICSVYIAILRRLYQHTRQTSVGRRTSISLKRVVKCSVLVVAFYFVCWSPYYAMLVAHIFGKGEFLCQNTQCFCLQLNITNFKTLKLRKL